MDTIELENKKLPAFVHVDIKLIQPDFDSDLTDFIISLETLRNKRITSEIHPIVFMQLKQIFHILESVENNRFEGNPTTLAEFIETRIEPNNKTKEDENYKAISNTERALEYIEMNIKKGEKISAKFIREIHRIVVEGLTPLPKGEGSKTPGGYKKEANGVGKHITPPPAYIEAYMDELENFINQDTAKKFELIITAIAHHRFVRIHPFDNGNGRVVRLLTYAMLIKQGFINASVKVFQIINPTGIFGSKKKYSTLLGKCDNGDEKAIQEWCEYVLLGITNEIRKIDTLLDSDYTKSIILYPAIKIAFDRHYITEIEYEILKVAVNKMTIKLEDIKPLFPAGTTDAKATYQVKKLKERGILLPTDGEKSRLYSIGFMRNEILRCIVQRLREEGFIDEEE